MEQALMIWLENYIATNIPVNENRIQKKLLQLYNHLKEQISRNADAAHKIKLELSVIKEDGGHIANQIFNANETALD
ncbi:hypothetical protein M0804_000265 [Polistes exclamans]|nr:hypothetical protein M0804_000265 [Polistes exclamans]